VRPRPGAVAAGVVAAFAFLACLRKIGSLDYWTHLAFGRAFVQARTLLVGEPFLAGGEGAPPPRATVERLLEAATASSEWPFQIGIFAVEAAGGHVAVSLAMAACGALAAALLASALWREWRAGRLAAGVAFAAAAFCVARFRFSPRPEAVAAVLLAAVLLLAFRWVERPRWRELAAIAAILVLWKPLHVTWALGAALAGAAIAAGPWLAFWRAQRPVVRLLSAAAVVAAAVPAARFAGFVLGELGRGGLLFAVTEMRPTWEFPSLAWPLAALATAGLALGWGAREGRAPRLAVWALAAVLGAMVVRNVAFAALAMVPVALRGLASWPARARSAPRERTLVAASALAVALLLGLVLRDRDHPFGTGVDWGQFPREAAEHVRSAPLEGPVFNSWDWGGYLAWAWRGAPRTFLDGRLSDRRRLADHDAVVGGNPGDALERYRFRTVLLQPLFRNSGRLAPGVLWFLRHPEWRLVHARDALVFARAPLPAGVAEASPADAWRVVLRHAAVVEEQDEPPLHARYTRAIALLELGDVAGARSAFEEARRIAPALAGAYAELGWVIGLAAGGAAR
jgi:hypothetical protein